MKEATLKAADEYLQNTKDASAQQKNDQLTSILRKHFFDIFGQVEINHTNMSQRPRAVEIADFLIAINAVNLTWTWDSLTYSSINTYLHMLSSEKIESLMKNGLDLNLITKIHQDGIAPFTWLIGNAQNDQAYTLLETAARHQTAEQIQTWINKPDEMKRDLNCDISYLKLSDKTPLTEFVVWLTRGFTESAADEANNFMLEKQYFFVQAKNSFHLITVSFPETLSYKPEILQCELNQVKTELLSEKIKFFTIDLLNIDQYDQDMNDGLSSNDLPQELLTTIKSHEDFNVKEYKVHQTALQVAIAKGYIEKDGSGFPLKHSNLELASKLLELGANEAINYQEPALGNTALHIAYARHDLQAVMLLKAYGAQENIQNHAGQTPGQMLNLTFFKAQKLMRFHTAPDGHPDTFFLDKSKFESSIYLNVLKNLVATPTPRNSSINSAKSSTLYGSTAPDQSNQSTALAQKASAVTHLGTPS